MANALIHQDMTISGAGPTVDPFRNRIEITNPGAPLVEIEMSLVESGPALDYFAEEFERDGFAFALRAFAAADIDHLRRRTETELLPLSGDQTRETDYTFQTHLLFPWLDAVVRHEPILEEVSRIQPRPRRGSGPR